MRKANWYVIIITVILALGFFGHHLYYSSSVVEDSVSSSNHLFDFMTEYRVTKGGKLEIVNTLTNISGKKLSVQTPFDCFQTHVVDSNSGEKIFSYAVISDYVYGLAINEKIKRKVVFELDEVTTNNLTIVSYLPYLINDVSSGSMITDTIVNELEVDKLNEN